MVGITGSIFTKIISVLSSVVIPLLILFYCSLIFVSRSVLGVLPTTILIALGIIALFLWVRGVIHTGKLEEVKRND